MKEKMCGECGKVKWTRRALDKKWTCARCIKKIQAGRRIKGRIVHAVN